MQRVPFRAGTPQYLVNTDQAEEIPGLASALFLHVRPDRRVSQTYLLGIHVVRQQHIRLSQPDLHRGETMRGAAPDVDDSGNRSPNQAIDTKKWGSPSALYCLVPELVTLWIIFNHHNHDRWIRVFCH